MLRQVHSLEQALKDAPIGNSPVITGAAASFDVNPVPLTITGQNFGNVQPPNVGELEGWSVGTVEKRVGLPPVDAGP